MSILANKKTRAIAFLSTSLLAASVTALGFFGVHDLDPSFAPVIGTGGQSVTAITKRSDGKLIVAGGFSVIAGRRNNKIGILNPDGSSDLSFNTGPGPTSMSFPTFDPAISYQAPQSDDKIVISGGFDHVDGFLRNGLARLNQDGTVDPTFDIGEGFDGGISVIKVLANDKILIGGTFSLFGSEPVPNLVRLNADGTLDTVFQSEAISGSSIEDIAVQSDGRIIVASGTKIMRLNANGDLDTSFTIGNPGGFIQFTRRVFVQADGKILVGGPFTTYNSISCLGIVRLNADGTRDSGFNASVDTNFVSILAFAELPDHQIIMAGSFTSVNGVSRRYIARLNSDGTLDTTFNAQITGSDRAIYTLQLLPNDSVLVGGNIGIVLFNNDGTVSPAFAAGVNDVGRIHGVAAQPDGKVLAVGNIRQVNGTVHRGVSRFNQDGSLDTRFNAGGIGVEELAVVYAVAVLADGKILIGGDMRMYNGVNAGGLIRLNSDGSRDTTFAGNVGDVRDFVTQPDGKIICVGGLFRGITRLNADGTVDSTFSVGSGVSSVYSVVVQPDGKIVIAGGFTLFNGTSQNRIARLNPNGSLDPTFSIGPGFDAQVNDIALQPDGKIVCVGSFFNINGIVRIRIARLNSDGSNDLSFDPGTSANNSVNTVTLQPNGDLFIGGTFDQFAGADRTRLARIRPDGILDPFFASNLTLANAPGALSFVITSFAFSGNDLLVAGTFWSINGVKLASIARLLDYTGPTPTATPTATPTSTPTGSPTPTPTTAPTACPITVLPSTVIASPLFVTAPTTRSRFQRAVYLITAGEIAAAGYSAGFSPSTIGWNYHRGNEANTGSGPLKIYLQNTADMTNTKSSTWAAAITDMTLVHDATTALPAASGPFDIALSEEEAFTYTGGGIYLAFDWGQYTGLVSAVTQVRGSTNLHNGLKGGQSSVAPPTTLFTSSIRPETRLNAGSVVNDAAVSVVYSYGQLTTGTTSDQIQALITNNGSSAMPNVPVTLNIVGAESFTDTQIISSLPSCGGQAMVTFAEFAPITLGKNTITVSIPTDDVAVNNSRSRQISVTNNNYSYKYPGTTPDGFSAAFNPGAAFVAKFDVADARSVSDVELEVFANPNATFRVVLYGDNGGTPDSTRLLYRDSADRMPTGSGTVPISIQLPTPVGVGPGAFYVGIEQTNSQPTYPSFDRESPIRSGSFFFSAPGPWIDFSPNRSEKLNIGVKLSGAVGTPTATPTPIVDTPFDYDGDGKADISVFRPADGNWYLQQSTDGFYAVNFGIATDKIVPADYDGDGKTDVAVYRPSTGIWYVVNSSDGTFTQHAFGIEEDLPAPADYDGDGKADITVFRPTTGTWYRQNSSDGSFAVVQFGTNGDVPTVGDFDGDGKADVAVFRPSSGAWYQLNSSDGSFFAEQFGISIDKIVPADYDGDGKTDIAIYRPADGLWYVKNSATSTYIPHIFGIAEDIPTPGDYDGDGKADIGVFRPSNGHWYISNSSNGSFTIFPWGQNGDTPTPAAYRN